MYKKPTTVELNDQGQLKEPCFQFVRKCFPKIQHGDWFNLQLEKNGVMEPEMLAVQHIVLVASAHASGLQACLEGVPEDRLSGSHVALGWGQRSNGHLVLIMAEPAWLKQRPGGVSKQQL